MYFGKCSAWHEKLGKFLANFVEKRTKVFEENFRTILKKFTSVFQIFFLVYGKLDTSKLDFLEERGGGAAGLPTNKTNCIIFKTYNYYLVL